VKRVFLRIVLVLVLFVALERFCRLQTAGFRIQKVIGESIAKQQTVLDPSLRSLLSQPYFFLGSGVQCYAFVSEDGQYVLKLLKHYHMPPRTEWLRQMPLPPFLESWRSTLVEEREKRLASIVNSHCLAWEQLAEETGLVHVQIQALGEPCVVTLYDKIGVLHKLSLRQTPFVLQKRADLVFASLEQSFSNPEEAKTKIDSLLRIIASRCRKGISNTDPIIHRNFGFIGTKAIEIDAGSFVEGVVVTDPLALRKEIYFETLELQEWLAEKRPELAGYLWEKILH
jgi:hypothetical protein